MNQEQLKEIYLDQKRGFVKKDQLIERDIKLSKFINTSQIVVITGVRRCGKSSLMRLIVRSMNLQEQDYCYFNFDDERISRNVDIFEQIYSIHRQQYDKEPILFFDEVQNILGWEKFVNRLYESGLKIFVTGSNASILSSEISTSLTGRNKTLELLPFSFSEYLRYKKHEFDINAIDSVSKAMLIREFNYFLKNGGFPLIVKEDDIDILDSYFKDILYRDIVARYRISQVDEIKQIGLYFAANVAKLFSYATLQKISGIKSLASINNYLHYYTQSYLYYYVRKFDFSLKKQILNPRKVYCVDQGFANRIGFNISANKGRILENIVFLQLLRKNSEVFYFSNKGECDFVLKQGLNIIQAIQVCYSLNNENIDREINGLLEAMNEFNLNEGMLIVYESDVIQENIPKEIKLIEIWKWLLAIDL